MTYKEAIDIIREHENDIERFFGDNERFREQKEKMIMALDIAIMELEKHETKEGK